MKQDISFWILVVYFSSNIYESYLCTPETVHCYENIPKRQFPARPRSCEPSDPRVKNESCYLCDNECKTIQEIDTMKKKGEKRFECERNRPTVKISCCLQAQMLNKKTTGDKYNCYGTNKSADPKKDCPFGTGGSHCQDEFTDQVKCVCFSHSSGLGHLLNHLIDCHEEHKPESWSECRIVFDKFSCSCNKTKEMEPLANIEYCSTPKTDTLKSGSEGQFSDNVYMAVLAVLMTIIIRHFGIYQQEA